MSKHDEIIDYIYRLPEGAKISVRRVSAHLGVSDGTSYRAIKDAEKEGLVKTIERVGTIRVAPKEEYIEGKLSFEQVKRVIEGTVLAGSEGLDGEISRFIIGAMRTEALETYLEEGALLIVGNREDAQRKALENHSGILITGGFGADPKILERADAFSLPVLSTTSDTFTVASAIQRELYNRFMTTNVITAADLLVRQEEYVYDIKNDFGKDFYPADKVTIILEEGFYLGLIRSKDLMKLREDGPEGLVFDASARPQSTIQRLRQAMSWHHLNIIPIIDDEGRWLGVVDRRDVFKQRELQKPEGLSSAEPDLGRNVHIDGNRLHIKVMPFLTDEHGSMIQSEFIRLMERLIDAMLKERNIASYHIDTMNIMNMKLMQLNQELVIEGEVLDAGEQFLRMEVITRANGEIHMKAVLLIQHYKEK
ncbi:CBS domain-containing protein [Salinicoccus jeotgali]|uniref:CBS domain-containing protein n=1 Tax=Salinicoccus jeotgali TaxID=381634 RepID=A0ABP7ETC5_9STAP